MNSQRNTPTKMLRSFQWVLFVIVTIFAVGFSIYAINDIADPSTNGKIGTVTVTGCDTTTYHNCNGNFISRDNSIKLTGVQISGENQVPAGEQFTAYGEKGSDVVTVPSSNETYTDIIVMAVLIISWLILAWRRIYLPLKKRRANRAPVEG